MATNYPPYVNAYGSIGTLIGKIKEAAVPPKFTQDFMATVLGLKSTSYRAMIPLLKRLGLLDGSNVPTQAYKDLRDESLSKTTLGNQIRDSYKELFAANEYAFKLTKDETVAKLRTVLGVGSDDTVVQTVAGTFIELCKHANFGPAPVRKNAVTQDRSDDDEKPTDQLPKLEKPAARLGISYTINLNLPATTEIEVFNAIFKSLKEHIVGKN